MGLTCKLHPGDRKDPGKTAQDGGLRGVEVLQRDDIVGEDGIDLLVVRGGVEEQGLYAIGDGRTAPLGRRPSRHLRRREASARRPCGRDRTETGRRAERLIVVSRADEPGQAHPSVPVSVFARAAYRVRSAAGGALVREQHALRRALLHLARREHPSPAEHLDALVDPRDLQPDEERSHRRTRRRVRETCQEDVAALLERDEVRNGTQAPGGVILPVFVLLVDRLRERRIDEPRLWGSEAVGRLADDGERPPARTGLPEERADAERTTGFHPWAPRYHEPAPRGRRSWRSWMRRWNGMKIGSVLSAGVVTVGLLAGCRDILGIVPLGGDGTGGSAATGSTGGSGGTSTPDAAGSSSGGSGSGGNGSIPFWQIGGPGEDIGNDIATVGQAVVMVGSSTDTIDKGFSEISIKQAAQDAIVVGCSTEGAATECTLHQRIGSLATKQSAQSVTIQPGTGAIYVGGMFEGKAAQPVVDKCPSNCSSSMPVQDDGVFLEHLSSSGGCVCADTMGINLVRDPQTIAIDSDATGVTTVALRSSETTSGSILGCAPATAPKTALFVARSTGDNTCTTVKNMIATGYAQQAPRIALDDQGAAFVAVSFPYDIGPEPRKRRWMSGARPHSTQRYLR